MLILILDSETSRKLSNESILLVESKSFISEDSEFIDYHERKIDTF